MESQHSTFRAVFQRKKQNPVLKLFMLFCRQVFLSSEKQVGKREGDLAKTGFCLTLFFSKLEPDKIHSCYLEIMHTSAN